ncbi:MAG: hypothetical protein ACE5HV_12495, partial [Acidobacteriota bacterium]
LVLEVRNAPVPNRVTARLGGEKVVRQLEPGETVELPFHPGHHFPFDAGTFLYRFTVTSSSGFVPRLRNNDNPDYRYLGLFVRPRVELVAVDGHIE